MSKLFPHHRGQMSEAFRTVMFLSASGGLQDAYTYIGRGKVFANAQTGNIVLMSQSLFDGDLSRFAHYFIPVLSFALGVAAAECIRLRWRQARRIHWRQLVVLAEIVLLFAVGLLPAVGYWRKTRWSRLPAPCRCRRSARCMATRLPVPCASATCAAAWTRWSHSDTPTIKNALWKSLHYFAIIFIFALGAGIGTQCVGIFGERTIWLSCALLLVSLCFMFIKEDLPEIEEELKK